MAVLASCPPNLGGVAVDSSFYLYPNSNYWYNWYIPDMNRYNAPIVGNCDIPVCTGTAQYANLGFQDPPAPIPSEDYFYSGGYMKKANGCIIEGDILSNDFRTFSSGSTRTDPKLYRKRCEVRSRPSPSWTFSDGFTGTPTKVCMATEGLYPQILWTPEKARNRTLWLDANKASTITESGGKVTKWTDASEVPNGIEFTVPISGAAPDFNASDALLNNMPTVSSSSSSGSIGLVSNSQIFASSIFIVCYYKDGIDMTFDVKSHILAGKPGTNGQYSVAGVVGTNEVNISTTDTTAFTYDGNQLYANGKPPFSSSKVINGVKQFRVDHHPSDNSGELQPWSLFHSPHVSNEGYEGKIAEVIMLSAKPTDVIGSVTEYELITGYLAHKYGIQSSMLGSHPFRYDPPYL